MVIKKAAIYIRVSTDAQRDEGYSIDAQKEMAEAFLISKGIKNFDFYIDGGFSGSNVDRPKLQQLINDVNNGNISTVVVYKLDRLSRSQKDTLYLIEDVFNPNGVDFISMNESMDTSTPLGRLMLGILSAFAQLERENIKERTRMGMKERIKSGLWMGGGRIPFGYDYDKEKGILVQNKDAPTVKKIYDLYLSGYSTLKISGILGLKYEKLAYQILRRKSNAGYIHYNNEDYNGMHKPIVSLETYEKAMALMAVRTQKRDVNSSYLLTGLIFCGKCGARMRYQKWGKKGCKIVCYSHDKSKSHMIKNPDCDNERMESDKLEETVFSELFTLSLKLNKKTTGITLNTGDLLNKILKDDEVRLKRLYELYGKNGDEILIETIKEIKDEIVKVKSQITIEMQKNINKKETQKIITELSTIKDTWKYMTLQEKRIIIINVIEKIVITDNELEIYYKF